MGIRRDIPSPATATKSAKIGGCEFINLKLWKGEVRGADYTRRPLPGSRPGGCGPGQAGDPGTCRTRAARCSPAAQLIGVGPVTASAAIASVGDFKQFKSGAQFGAWLGLVPRQRSSGGKSQLGGITKRGQTYLRMLLVQAAKSAVMTAHRRDDRISRWVLALRERSGWQKAVVALANKNARILWAVMTRGEAFDANHVSVKPQGA